jgi:hypothetical protein
VPGRVAELVAHREDELLQGLALARERGLQLRELLEVGSHRGHARNPTRATARRKLATYASAQVAL